ncbi:MAG: hypothetical protein OEN00_10400, partial [Gemmatimonadota bacterium]|nr:hypothetical protein [Gemmatimonadota bacterium]
PSSSATVTLTLSGPGGAVLQGTAARNAVAGVAVFEDLSTERAASGYVLTATSPGLTAVASSSFDVVAAGPGALAFLATPSDVAIGAALDRLEVALMDVFGNRVESGLPISVELVHDTASLPPLDGTTSLVPTDGIVSFDDLRVLGGIEDARLRASFGSVEIETEPLDVFLPFMDISVGNAHTCGIAGEHATREGEVVPEGVVYCWGDGEFGQTGQDAPLVPRPTMVLDRANARAHRASALTSGADHTCSLDLAGAAFCWGNNSYSQLGDVAPLNTPEPTPIGSAERFASIRAGSFHSCGITTGGAVLCWGSNRSEQIRKELRGTTPSEFATPTAPFSLTEATSVAPGAVHTCASGLDPSGDAVVLCRGFDVKGQAGVPDFLTGVSRITEPRLTSLAASLGHTCGVTSDGIAHCWGSNDDGQLGDGGLTSRPSPAPVASSVRFERVHVGNLNFLHTIGFTCARTTASDTYCWGSNETSTHGTAQPGSRTPVRIDHSVRFRTLSMRWRHACGVSLAGRAFCWGDSRWGRLGTGWVVGVQSTPRAVLWPLEVILP